MINALKKIMESVRLFIIKPGWEFFCAHEYRPLKYSPRLLSQAFH
jgi:hypothetical protein